MKVYLHLVITLVGTLIIHFANACTNIVLLVSKSSILKPSRTQLLPVVGDKCREDT